MPFTSPPVPLAAAEAARALWARAAGNAGTPSELVQAAERMSLQLRAGLGRWVGLDGYRALLERALSLTRTEHPVLESLSLHGGDGVPRGSRRAPDAADVAAGMIALVTTLIELLTRIIGEEMAVRLVEQVGIPGPRKILGTNTGGYDG
jgi:hypothetical protein